MQSHLFLVFFNFIFFLSNFFFLDVNSQKFNFDILYKFFKYINSNLINYYYLEFSKYLKFLFKFRFKNFIFSLFSFIKNYKNKIFLI